MKKVSPTLMVVIGVGDGSLFLLPSSFFLTGSFQHETRHNQRRSESERFFQWPR